MEDELISLLAATQSPAAAPRQQAEAGLEHLYANPSFGPSLISVAQHSAVELPVRQSALLILKNYVLATWSPELDGFKGQCYLEHDTKQHLRTSLLELATAHEVDRKIRAAASYVVSKIAGVDFPDQWPDLLDQLLGLIRSAPEDARLHGALKVLAELVGEGLDEAQFFRVARDLVRVLYEVTVEDSRRAKLKALAVTVLKEGFNTLQVLQEDHKVEVKAFADESLGGWMDLLLAIIHTPLVLPPEGSDDGEDGPVEAYRGLVALKIQVTRVLITIRLLFPSVIAPRSPALFSAVWQQLKALQETYQSRFVDNDIESRLVDQDGLPYTLDFLMLESLDFMQGCIRAPPVRLSLAQQSPEDSESGNWIVDFMRLVTSFAQITVEEEGMWEIDVNVFLAEETGVTANYTARLACGDLVIKVGEWQNQKLIEGLLIYVRELFAAEVTNGQDPMWRLKEASLFILSQVLSDWQDFDRKLDPSLSESLLAIARQAQQSLQPFLRARGYTVAGAVLKSSVASLHGSAGGSLQQNIQAIQADQSEVVQVSCVRAIQAYLAVLPRDTVLQLQAPIVQVLQQWLSRKEMDDLTESEELLFALVETLRDVILLDTRICLGGDGLHVLFTIVSRGSDNYQMTNLVAETFEEICSTIALFGDEAYAQLSQKVLPSLTGAFDVGTMTEENSLSNIAAEMLSSLTEHAPSPLPAGFVSAVLPKIIPLLLNHSDDELLKSCTTSLQNILEHDPEQTFSYTNDSTTPSKSGIDLVLEVIDRLLSPAIEDNAAAEVGGLAATLVEKAGPERLGQYLMPLLRAVALRVGTATKVDLTQSLILVFARLALFNAKDVIDFLLQVSVPSVTNQSTGHSRKPSPEASSQSVGSKSGLEVVIASWLEHAPTFAGYAAIRTNIIALIALYSLHDPRLAAVTVKGDLVVPVSDRIVTRSRAKANPDTYTSVSAPVKILKLLIEELAVAGAGVTSNPAAGVDANGASLTGESRDVDVSDDEDDEWEDDDTLAAFGGGEAAAALKAFAEEEVPGSGRGGADAETFKTLEDFFRGQAADEQFKTDFERLTEKEREVLGRM